MGKRSRLSTPNTDSEANGMPKAGAFLDPAGYATGEAIPFTEHHDPTAGRHSVNLHGSLARDLRGIAKTLNKSHARLFRDGRHVGAEPANVIRFLIEHVREQSKAAGVYTPKAEPKPEPKPETV
jgi:hypothetical protein